MNSPNVVTAPKLPERKGKWHFLHLNFAGLILSRTKLILPSKRPDLSDAEQSLADDVPTEKLVSNEQQQADDETDIRNSLNSRNSSPIRNVQRSF